MIKYAERKPLDLGIKILDDKRTIRKTVIYQAHKTLVFMKALVEHFIKHPDPLVVPVYSFEVIKESELGNNTYAYTMMRLGILSEAEEELIDFVGDMHDSYGAAACIQEVKYPWQDKCPELFSFLKTVVEQQRYWDIHSGNILMDPDGQYRLIDLESFIKTPLILDCNDWISREEQHSVATVTPIAQRASPIL